jgi:drug/metabolite transporter (DMT)-like permease
LGRPASTVRERRLAELGVLLVTLVWASNFIVVKGAVEILPPIAFSFLRYCIAAITLLILLRWREGEIRLPHGDIRRIFVLGAIGFGCYQILWPVALQTIPAGDSALLIATTPVLTALLAMAVGADKPNVVKLVGAFVSFAGVALVIAAGQRIELGTSLVGDGLTLVAAGCWAVYTVFGARVLRRHSPLVTTTWAIVAGTVFLAPLGIAQLLSADMTGALSDAAPVALAIVYSGTIAAGFANVIVFHGVKLLGPTRVTALQFLVPALAVAMAAVFLGEAIRPIQIVGGVVILAGVALLRRGSWPGRNAARAIGSVARFESSCTSRSLARWSLSYSSAINRRHSSSVNRASSPMPTVGSAAVSCAPLCTHSHRMLKRISPVAMSSIRYSTSSSPKKSAGFNAAAWKPRPNALPYCSATLIRSRAPRIVRGAGSSRSSPSASDVV